ncbi:MAG: hypothetical protein H7A55_04455 [Verrucomicrobiaceae bacterium]|nr:hypothetical protein [Verrucomicrobiaceae bacterium]
MKASSKNPKSGISVTAHRGDARTLLAFNLPKGKARNLAGFTLQVTPKGKKAYYIYNTLRFKNPEIHSQVAGEAANSSVNAPIHKFRWVHVPGSVHQGTQPFFGTYKYTVTPRYFDAKGCILPLDAELSISVNTTVAPFSKGNVTVGFTRGFTQSQAFTRHFGKDAKFHPATDDVLFDTSAVSGKNPQGQSYTFADEYNWLGFTARDQLFGLIKELTNNKNLRLDIFAYDFNEPDIAKALLELAKVGRVRMILDNAKLHHSTTKPPKEDKFEALFTAAASSGAAIMRGKFGRFAHDKVWIISDTKGPLKVLTGSTNFSITGLYVNSNHVLTFNDRTVAAAYAEIFNLCWDAKMWGGKQSSAFSKTPQAAKTYTFASKTVPPTSVTFSPHTEAQATTILTEMANRIVQEGKTANGSVLFAVMGMDQSATGPVFPVLRDIHKDQNIFSYGISDAPGDGISLYTRRKKTGVLVSGKPSSPLLPPPFNQVHGVGIGHQVHHKFVVCGFNGKNPVVYCGSSNLALGGEQANGDNLIAIKDPDIATAFAIEALGLVDHFDFLDLHATAAKKAAKKPANKMLASAPAPTASKSEMADAAEWFLSTTDRWAAPYYDKEDLHYTDRLLFAV